MFGTAVESLLSGDQTRYSLGDGTLDPVRRPRCETPARPRLSPTCSQRKAGKSSPKRRNDPKTVGVNSDQVSCVSGQRAT